MQASAFTALGKIPQSALQIEAPGNTPQNRSTRTKKDGAWSFARVHAPGYYLVTFAKLGYQTQRYVIDSSAAVATDPLSVELAPGQGRLSGVITSARGAVGGATITISDGTNTVTTSSNSRGAIGRWSIDGLSTPSAYLVSASSPGLSTESRIVVLRAGGTGVANLRLGGAATELVGKVSGPDSLGATVGLGGARVTVRGGGTTRTATTVTNGNLAGYYQLPDLPPGTYTVTMSADGYLPETQRVLIHKGRSQATANAVLTSAAAVVVGTVRGVQFDADGNVRTKPGTSTPLIDAIGGAGIVLASPQNTYKITSSADGSFRMSGITPGTYVLSAQFAGLATAYVTVTAVAGQTTRVPLSALLLNLPTTTDSSTIAGFVASESPSGTLSCPAATTPGSDCNVYFTLVDSAGRAVPTRTGNGGEYLATSTTAPATNGPTHYTLSARLGLRAGLYRLTIGASGYLPATVNVRVPRGAVAEAPQVTLFPTNTITGTVDMLGDVTHDGPGAPYRTCVWAIPTGRGIPVPTDCDYTPPKVSTCLTRGIAEPGFAIVDPDSFLYAVKGLCDGDYDMYVVTANPWYVTAVSATSVSVTHGQTLTYSPHLQRKGRVLLTLAVLDPDSGAITAATTLSGTATCGAGTSTDLSTMAVSQVVVNGVTASAAAVCTVSATDGGVELNGTVTGLSVGNDTDTHADVTLTEQVGNVAGRVVSAYEGSDDNPVQGIRVSVNGIVGYNGTTPVRKTIVATTDNNGCFAITPAGGVGFDTRTTACGVISAANSNDSLSPLPLVARAVDVSTPEVPGSIQASTATVKLATGTVTDVRVLPQPVDASGLLLRSTNGADVTGATVTAIADPAPGAGANGAGTLRVTVDPGGQLDFLDSNIGQKNQVWPGTYDLTASLPGFGTASATLTCRFGTPLCSMTSFVLVQLGTLSGVLTGYQGTNTGYPSHPIAGATLTAVKCDAQQASPNCTGSPTLTAPTDTAGNYTFTTGGVANLALGTWQVTVSAPGYQTVVEQVEIRSGSNTLPQNYLFTSPVDFAVGIQTSANRLFRCPTANPTCATVTLLRIDTGEVFSQSTADTDRRYDFPSLNPATYLITISGDGLTQTNTLYTVPLGISPATLNVPVALTRNTISGAVNGPVGRAAAPTPLDDVSVELGHLDGSTFVVDQDTDGNDLVTKTAANAGVHGTFVFSNVPNGSYVARFNHGAGTPVVNGYGETITTGFVSVANGQAASFPDTSLPRITHNVELSVTTTADGDDVAASALTLTSTTDSSWTFTASPATSTPRTGANHGVVDKWTVPAVPFGDWRVSMTLPTGHLGVLSGSNPSLTCTVTDVNTATPCVGSPLTVPGNGSPSTPVTTGYTLDEYRVGLSVVAHKLGTDPNASVPTGVHLSVLDGARTVYSQDAFTVSAAAPATPTDAFWGRNNRTYATATTGFPANWTAPQVTLSEAAPRTPVALNEIGASVRVTVTGFGTATSASVVLLPPAGSGMSAPAAHDVTPGAPSFTFDDVPFGAGWRAQATAGARVGTSSAFTVDSSVPTVTVTLPAN